MQGFPQHHLCRGFGRRIASFLLGGDVLEFSP